MKFPNKTYLLKHVNKHNLHSNHIIYPYIFYSRHSHCTLFITLGTLLHRRNKGATHGKQVTYSGCQTQTLFSQSELVGLISPMEPPWQSNWWHSFHIQNGEHPNALGISLEAFDEVEYLHAGRKKFGEKKKKEV